MLFINHIHKQIAGTQVINPLSLHMAHGTNLAIAGETGSGKSTLLKMIAGLVQPDSGEIFFEGEKVIGPLDQLIPGHKHIAYLSQHYELRNNYVVFDYLDYGSQMTAEEGDELYSLCEINHLLQRKTNSGLSGGERQRIALAKMLTKRPKLLLLDEPFSNLDTLHKQTIKQVIHQLQLRFQVSIILVSHEAADLLPWADEMMVMKAGSIVQKDTPEKIYHEPLNAYVAGLLGAFVEMDTEVLQHFFPKHFKEINTPTVLLRPEHWQVTSQATNAVEVQVIRSSFFGNSYLLEVMLATKMLLVRAAEKPIAPFSSVFISPALLHK
jgi:ABC-type sugar transport system ATPase subunit